MLPCHECAYRESIPGDCHSKCSFAWDKTKDPVIQAGFPRCDPNVAHWFMFPMNYDPVWGPDSCPAKAAVADPAMKADSSGALIALLKMMGR